MKELFKTHALEHHIEMLDRFKDDIELSVNVIHNREDIPQIDINDLDFLYEDLPYIYVTNHDTVTEIIKQARDINASNVCIAALNFASYLNPGGGFLSGAMSQEESLCHNSDLYERLKHAQTFYDYNVFHSNGGAYEDRLLYSYTVHFLGDSNEVYNVDVITCAAPNLQALKAKGLQDINFELLRNRIRFMLEAAEFEGVDWLILGAWGCGVFGQDPKEVAKIFKEELMSYKYGFERVIFAIPEGYNHDCFKEIFK